MDAPGAGSDRALNAKDFWVCWLLRRLVAPPLLPGVVFKGGTSLSKVWEAISRFSEDIDITVPRSALPGGNEAAISEKQSRSQNAKGREQLSAALEAWCGGPAHAELRDRIVSSLGGDKGWSLAADADTLEFEYPTSVSSDSAAGLYVKPTIRVEFGALMPTEPAEQHAVRPYCAAAGSYRMPKPETKVAVLSPVRTFWEKATLLHAENARPAADVRDRISRHYADLAGLADHAVGKRAIQDRATLADVASKKQLHFPVSYVDYAVAGEGRIVLAPPDVHLPALRKDYEKMREMYFTEPTSFDDIVDRLKRLQAEIRG